MQPEMTDPIIAYRSWGVSASGRQIKSTGHGTKAWARLSAPAAACVHESSMFGFAQMMAAYGYSDNRKAEDDVEHHEAPSFKCKCGYYAMKRVQDIPSAKVYGRVALWGHIIEHDHGYRAQFAYPQVFFAQPKATPEDIERLRVLAAAYGCEIAPMPQELVDELLARQKKAEEERKNGGLWYMDPAIYFGNTYTLSAKMQQPPKFTIIYDLVTPEPENKIEKAFSAQTMRHPFKAFMGGFIPPHRRKK